MSPSETVRDRRRLGPAASIAWLALAAFFGIVIVTGTSGEAYATDWIWIGGYLMIIATSLLGELRRPYRARQLVGILKCAIELPQLGHDVVNERRTNGLRREITGERLWTLITGDDKRTASYDEIEYAVQTIEKV